MSYDTRYRLETDGYPINDAIVELNSINDFATFALSDTGGTKEGCSWYDHEEHLIELSMRHPDTLFTLHGEGENNEDIWRKYFKYGKMQECRAVITFAPFDESKLE